MEENLASSYSRCGIDVIPLLSLTILPISDILCDMMMIIMFDVSDGNSKNLFLIISYIFGIGRYKIDIGCCIDSFVYNFYTKILIFFFFQINDFSKIDLT